MSRRNIADTRMRGLSLVELLVAITLGAIILGGAVTLFVNNRDTYHTTNQLSRLQETARYALDMMVKDIRMAGYFGCADRLDTVSDNTGAAAGALWNPANPIEGWEGDIEGNYLPSNVPGNGFGSVKDNVADNPGGPDGDDGRVLPLGGIVPDSITVRYLAGSMNDVTDPSSPAGSGPADDIPDNQVAADVANSATPTIDVNSTLGYAEFQVAGISDCGGADIFQIMAPLDATVMRPNAITRGYNITSTPMIAPFVGIRYYIGANGRSPDPVTDPYPSLYRTIVGPTALAENSQELFEGVESMQILYGVDTDADGTPNSYVRAGDAPLDVASSWANVVSVRIAILVRTIDQFGRDTDGNTYTLNDHDDIDHGTGARPRFDPPNDRRLRRVFTTTVMVRNL